MASVTEQKPGGEQTSESDQSRYSKFASRILNDALRLKPGENLTIEAWEHELDFAREIKFQAQKMGANVLLVTEDDKNFFRLAESGAERSVGKVGRHEWALLENTDAYVFFPGPADIQRHMKLDAKKRSATTAYNGEWYDRAAKAGVRGVRLRTAYATPSRADLYSFPHKQWYDDTLEAIDVDYERIEKTGQKLASMFRTSKIVRIKAANGTNLEIGTSKLKPHVYSGALPRALRFTKYSGIANLPGSELDIVPNPKRVDGKVKFDRPVLQNGAVIEGLEWTFKNGMLSGSTALKNYGLFAKDYARAKGQKDRLGVIVLGLTPKLSYGFTNDMYVEGAVSLGLGSFGEGDKNNTDYSFIATISKATVELDDKKIIESGKLKQI
jgi:leucyl aminopeptidase (aminopeptidase T)